MKLEFSWLFVTDKQGNPNWLSIHEGKFNWALEAERSGASKNDAADEFIKKMEAENR
jgi:hypothetical protein